MALSSSVVTLGIFIGIYALLALGLNLKFGYTGLLDIGHVAFYLVGAYATALLVAPPASTQQFADYILGLNWPWIPAVAVGVFAAGVFGMLVALPAIRLREDYLAITLLGVSVIVQRVIQVEGWLANGPGTLRNYGAPLQSLFPLPSPGVEGAVLLGALVAVVYATTTFLLTQVGTVGRADSTRERVVHALLFVLTFGAGYLAARRATGGDRPGAYAALAGLVVGVVAVATAALGFGTSTVFVFFGLASLFTWVFAAVALADYYAGFSGRDAVVAAGLAVGFVVVFVPLIVLGGKQAADVRSTVGLVATGVLLVGYVYGIYRLARAWDRIGGDSGTGFVSIVGVGAATLFAIRYFGLALVTPFKNGGADAAASNLVQNLFWMMKFRSVSLDPAQFLAETVVIFGYQRFLLVLILGLLGVVYLAMETTVTSPFGRVLKAIREDEDVATALGKDTFSYKVQSMILGSAVAGLAGALWAIFATSITFSMFAPRVTFFAFLMVIIGGTANNRGVVLGSVIYWAFQQGTTDVAAFFPTAARSSVQALRLAFIGALLIVILYYRPEGIWGERRIVSGGESGD